MAVELDLPVEVVVEHRGNDGADGAGAPDAVDVGVVEHRGARGVEADHRDVEAGVERARGGLGVEPDVELGRRRDVAQAVAPAHHGDAAEAREQLGAQRGEQRDVRERPDRVRAGPARRCARGSRPAGRPRASARRPRSIRAPAHRRARRRRARRRRDRGARPAAAPPAATGTSSRPARASTASALRVVVSSGRLPATVVSASSSTSGLASASRIAIASSTPGSQSMTSGVATGRAV